MMSSCSKRKLQRAKERERWREGREKQMSIKPRNGKSMFARGPSSSLSHSVYYWLRPRFYIMANPRARIWETKKNAQNFRKTTGKVLQKWKNSALGGIRSLDRPIMRPMRYHLGHASRWSWGPTFKYQFLSVLRLFFFFAAFLEIFIYLARSLSTRAFFFLVRTLTCGWRLSEKQKQRAAL